MKFPSWGLQPKIQNEFSIQISLRTIQDLIQKSKYQLARGLGRSYGDVCLLEGHPLLLTSQLNRFIDFDRNTGLLTCQAGVSFEEVLKVFVPQGWFLPVTPGTKFVTVGGAIANDVHGKNHHSAGSFGRFIKHLKILRSDGITYIASEDQNSDLFHATIGGLGLTGLILEVAFYLKPISSAYIDQEQIRFSSVEEFLRLSHEAEEHGFEYSVAWIDCVNGRSLKGIFIQGNHSKVGGLDVHQEPRLNVPVFFPSWILNSLSIRIFNALYYLKNYRKRISNRVHYNSFFYPLDGISNWNKIYGRKGFFQYQCVVPPSDAGIRALNEILNLFKENGSGSFLAVLKTFGSLPNKGNLSFPMEGVTIALDFANRPGIEILFEKCNKILRNVGGRVYPAKDAHMSASDFHAFYSEVPKFQKIRDHQFHSEFSRRVQL